MPTFIRVISSGAPRIPAPARTRKTPRIPAQPGESPHRVHRGQEFLVRLRELELVQQELHALHGVELGERLAQEPDLLELVLLEEQLFLPRARLLDVDRREDPLVHQPAIEMNLHVAGPLELLEDDVVHPASGIDDGRRHDRERSALLDVPRRCEEAARPPDRTFPDDGMTALWARAKRVSESSRITTSRLCSTRRLAFSITMSATWMCRWGGSSKVDEITSPFTDRCMSVTSSGRSSMRSTMR